MQVWGKIDLDFLGKRGIPVPDDLEIKIKNLTFSETALYFKERFNIPDSAQDIMDEWNDMAYNEYAHNIKLKTGSREFLSLLKLKGIKVGLATTNCKKLLEATLNKNGIFEYFDAISTADEVGKGKNCPDIYLLTAKKLGINPDECIVFEDILPAVMGAKAAGMKVIGVYDECSKHEIERIKDRADGFIISFEELM